MFIEELWEKYPEQTINVIKKITKLKDYSFEYVEFENNCLKFDVYDDEDAEYKFTIYVSDFYMNVCTSVEDYEISKQTIQWIKFMYSIYGNKYALQYISKRNQQLDKFMAEYDEKHNNQTRKVLEEIGFQSNKGKTK